MRGRYHQARRWHSPKSVYPSSLLYPSQIACEIFCLICTWWNTHTDLVTFSINETQLPNRSLQNKTVVFTSSFIFLIEDVICCIPLIPREPARLASSEAIGSGRNCSYTFGIMRRYFTFGIFLYITVHY